MAFGAIGFVNQANDSSQQKKNIRKKFSSDLQSALKCTPKPDVFVFFTNVNFTAGEKESLSEQAVKNRIAYCDIFERERMRILLDSPDGFSIRFQYLDIPLSEAEQSTFFAKWGDEIHSVISTGFQKIETTLDRILFLHESSDVMTALFVTLELDRIYSAEEIGHFRTFCSMYLKEPKHEIFEIIFGTFDRSARVENKPTSDFLLQEPGIKNSIGGGQWEHHISDDDTEDDISHPIFTNTGSSSSIGRTSAQYITMEYHHDHLIRFFPRLLLRDIDRASFIIETNSSLATKVKSIHVYSNGYKLAEVQRDSFWIDTEPSNRDIPVEFSENEIQDTWVRIRPKKSTVFKFDFAYQTPKRLFEYRQTTDSLEQNTND